MLFRVPLNESIKKISYIFIISEVLHGSMSIYYVFPSGVETIVIL